MNAVSERPQAEPLAQAEKHDLSPMREPQGVVAVFVGPDGHQVAAVADFDQSGYGGFSLHEAQTLRIKDAIASEVARRFCSDDYIKHLDRYKRSEVINAMVRNDGYHLHCAAAPKPLPRSAALSIRRRIKKMLTIKHVERDGKETVFPASEVKYDPVHFREPGYISGYVWYVNPEDPYQKRNSNRRLESGIVYIMNPQGATVSVYHLGPPDFGPAVVDNAQLAGSTIDLPTA